MRSQESMACALGNALRVFDPERRCVSAAALGNLSRSPQFAQNHLRHVLPKMLKDAQAAEFLKLVDWDNFHPTPQAFSSFWFGFYATEPAPENS